MATQENEAKPKVARIDGGYPPAGYPSSLFGTTSPMETDVGELIGKLWRRKGVILGVVVILTALAAVIIAQLTPLYTATAQTMINPRKNQVVNLEAVLAGLPLDQETIQSEIQVIKSRGLAERVVKKLGLDRVPEFNSKLVEIPAWKQWLKPRTWLPPEWSRAVFGEEMPLSEEVRNILERGAVVSSLSGALEVKRVARSRVLEISITSADPALARKITNTVADLYIVEQLEAKFEATRKATTWLNDRLSDLRKQVAVTERAVEVFRNESGLTQSRGITLVAQEISELSTQHVLSRLKRVEAEARQRQVQALLKNKKGAASASEVLASLLIQSLRGQEAEVLRKEAELSQEYGRKHPRLINIRSEVENIRGKIAAEVDRVVQGLKNEVSVARTREQSLSASIRQLERRVGALNRSEVRLRALEREAKANRTLYENFLSRFKELSKQGDIQQADAHIVSYAARPVEPSFPKTTLLLGLALVGSLFAGIGTASALEYFDVGFRSMQEVEQQSELPALGLIPALARSVKKPEDYVLNTPYSAYSESIRSLYTSLHLSNVDEPPKSVLMASSVPEEGKSLTAISLARLVAMSGKKVILVDADLRRPTTHDAMGLRATPGVVEVLSGEVTVDQALQVDSTTGLYVLTAGNQPANPVDLLTSQHFKKLLEGLRKEADLVVIDSPPLTAVSDARILSTLADKTVFIVRWAMTRRETVLMTLGQLRSAGADLAGIILSRVDIAKHARYGYGDSGYYHGRSKKYYTDAQRPSSPSPSPPPPPRSSA